MLLRYVIFISVFAYCIVKHECFELLTTAAVAVISTGLYAGWTYSKCFFFECCDGKWVKKDLQGLKWDFRGKVHGQHLAVDIVFRALQFHLENPKPNKALVLSFHGRTGSGKNHVVNLSVDRIFERGLKSKVVKLWYSKLHFPHRHLIDRYRQEVRKTILDMLTFCPRSFFIFDEADYLPEGLRDELKHFMDYRKVIDGVDTSKATFIFLSNTGGNDIARFVESFLDQNKNREDITIQDIYPLIRKGSFKEKGDVEGDVIDHYVPFLPLDEKHVSLCVEDFLIQRNCLVREEFVKKIADNMEYDHAYSFSRTGCKTVEAKINIMLEDECN